MTHLPSWAVPGRKVVCVDDRERNPPRDDIEWVGTLDGLTAKTTYTIRAADYDPLTHSPVVHLVEIVRPPCEFSGDAGYLVWRFRPVVALEEDMLTFRSLLNTVPATNHSKELTE